MTITQDSHIQAIPTIYSGIHLKSRMEAQCALLFDTLGWNWKYEPFSIMLPNGVPYTPDFLIEGHKFVIECRGYDSEKGRKQIQGFSELMGPRGRSIPQADRYMVISSEQANTELGDLICDGIGFCFECFMWDAIKHGAGECPYCGRASDLDFLIEAPGGKVLVSGIPSDKWEFFVGYEAIYDRWAMHAIVETLSSSGHREVASAVEDHFIVEGRRLTRVRDGFPFNSDSDGLLDTAWVLVQRAKKRMG